MLKNTLFLCVAAVLMLATACGTPVAVSSGPQPLATAPAAGWAISLTQSGGIAGVMLKVVVTSDGQLTATDERSGRTVTRDLPSDTVARLASLAANTIASTPSTKQSNCADCFKYDLQIDAGGRSHHFQADDTTLEASGAQDLIRVLQGLRDGALKGQL